MTNTKSMFRLLQLFADGGAEGNAAGTETGATEAVAAPQSGEKDLPITYLDQPEEPAEEPVAEAPQEEAEDLEAEFDALIKKDGKFAKVYEKKFRNALNGRMKENREQAENFGKQQKIIGKLAQVYGVDSSDYEAVEKAMDADENLFSQAAMDAGMSVEAFKELSDLRAQKALYEKAHEEQVQRERADETYRQWLADADKVKEIYPGFDLEAELNNPVFNGLLRNGFPVQNAYEAAHVQELIPQAMQVAVQTAEAKLAKKVAANQARPAENANSRTSTATVKRDVASLSNEELDEIDRLSRRRRISLG